MKVKQYVFLVLFVTLAIDGLCGSISPDQDADVWYREGRSMYYGMPVQVHHFPSDELLSKRVWAYLESINDVFNDYKAGSEIYAINRQGGTNDVTLSPMLAEAFSKARQAWVLSEGTFDITSAPIRNLWKEAVTLNAFPSDADISRVRAECGLNLTAQDGAQLTRSIAGLQFDFGGIIKGMIADHAIGMLKEGGVQSALVQVGGETVAFGLSQKERPFRIAIQHPDERTGAWGVIQDPGSGISASTSGNYEQPIIIKGQKFYHIMDMRTGRPVQTDVVSVSVAFPEIGKNWMADTLSTTGVLLGPEKTFEIVQRLGGEAMFLIRKDGVLTEVTSSGWEKFK
ncbi:MAG: FAD:protein FMN transferase [Kiritimatiellaceae bacterium]|nr:FAD:protein FMN transferase [Kiritimatiellaceae bacterium]